MIYLTKERRVLMKEAFKLLKGKSLPAVGITIIYYIVLSCLANLVASIGIPAHFKIISGFVLAGIILIPLTAGYIEFIRLLVFEDLFQKLRFVFKIDNKTGKTIISVLTVTLLIILSTGLGLTAGIYFATKTLPDIRFYVIVLCTAIGVLGALYICFRFWPLIYVLNDKDSKKITFFLKETLKITKGTLKEYLKFILPYFLLFLVCLLPLGLGLLIFFPVFTVDCHLYYMKKRENI